MKQCAQLIKSGVRCKRPAVDGCYGYCKPHFNDLPPHDREKAIRRSKAKDLIKGIGKSVGQGVGFLTTIKEIWELVGPFLSLREQHHLEIFSSQDAPHEIRAKSKAVLMRSFSNPSVSPKYLKRRG
jgi:hypothetical protein